MMLLGKPGWYWKGRFLDSHGIHGKISGASDSSTKVEEDAKVALGYVSSRVDQLPLSNGKCGYPLGEYPKFGTTMYLLHKGYICYIGPKGGIFREQTDRVLF